MVYIYVFVHREDLDNVDGGIWTLKVSKEYTVSSGFSGFSVCSGFNVVKDSYLLGYMVQLSVEAMSIISSIELVVVVVVVCRFSCGRRCYLQQ